MALGVPYNLAGYALLLELFARLSGIPAARFAHTLIDAHVYTAKPDGTMAEYDHVPGLREQLAREPRALPRLTIAPADQGARRSRPAARGQHGGGARGVPARPATTPHPAIPFKVAV